MPRSDTPQVHQEEWRPVPGFADYQVSSTGRVISYRRRKAHELSISRNRDGYGKVVLHGDEGSVTRLVHRLMALAFLGEPPAGTEVRHLDGTRRNDLANIEYATRSVNALDRVAHGVHNNARKTHCPQNHPYDDENTRLHRGRRSCRACNRATAADRSARSRARQALRAAGIAVAA